MAEARVDLERRQNMKLKLLEAGAAGRTVALKSRLVEVEQREEVTASALASAQAKLVSSRAEVLSL